MNEKVDALTKEKELLELNMEALNKDLREVKAQKIDAEKLIESVKVICLSLFRSYCQEIVVEMPGELDVNKQIKFTVL